MPPTPGKALYSSWWVLVSLEGFHLPSTTLPVSSSTTTMSSAVMLSYSTPEGLMTIRPLSRSTADTLPQVKVTRPYLGKRRLASKTSCLSDSNIFDTSFTVCGARPLGRAMAECRIKLARRGRRAPRHIYFSFQARSFQNSSCSKLSTVVSLPMWTNSISSMLAQSFICSAVTS